MTTEQDKAINDGGAAFPFDGMMPTVRRDPDDPDGWTWTGNKTLDPDSVSEGMSLRDYFAAKAMQGLLAGGRNYQTWVDLSLDANEIADAMLAAREGGAS